MTETVDFESVTGNLFRQVFDEAPIGIFLVGLDGRFLRINSVAAAITGYTATELLAINFQTITHPDDLHTDLHLLHEVLDGRRTNYRMDKRYIRKDGTIVWVQLDVGLIREAAGKPGYFVSHVQDITGRIQSESALNVATATADRERRQAARYLNLVDALIVALDREGRITLINPRGCAILGHPHDQLVGRNWFDTCLPAEERRAAHQLFERLVDGTTDPSEVPFGLDTEHERAILTASGEQRILCFRTVLMRDEHGRVSGSLSSAFDVTERTRLQTSLRAATAAAECATKAKSDFLAVMSHEIRTPINGVLGLTEMLLRTSLDPQQRELIETLRTCGDSLLVQVNDILDFSKIEAGLLELESVTFSMESAIDDAIALVSEKIQAKNLYLAVVHEPGQPALLQGDAARIRQVVANLLSNAAKFTEHGGISIRTRMLPSSLTGTTSIEVAVVDTGIGMPPSIVRQLFLPFTQGDASTTRRFGGTGLGLSICKRLVTAMNGTIDVISSPGAGSQFRFSIPCIPSSAIVDPEFDSLRGLRALVVIENNGLRVALQEQLGYWGVVTAVVPASEAADIIRAQASLGKPYSVVIGDGDGVDAEAVLTARDRHSPSTRLLCLCSTLGSPSDLHLVKPVRTTHLRRRLLWAIGKGQRTEGADRGRLQAVKLRGHVLVADDNQINRLVTSAMLTRLGLTCDLVSDGREALSAIDRTTYDVILMDCRMPDVSGLEATASHRRREAAKGDGIRIPIIALTAGATAEERNAAMASGMDAVLVKPVREESLITILQPHLTTPEPHPFSQQEGDLLVDVRALSSLQADTGDTNGFLRLFSDEWSRANARLHQAAAAGNIQEIMEITHTLKSTTLLLGFHRLTHLIMAIETGSQGGDLVTVRYHLGNINAVAEASLLEAKHIAAGFAP
ncbi:MAG: PAS domain S-box protein [Nitrosomonadales bacterium]|nr:PAS domain S-box protein [Nitrosomonadales bacterium]